MSAFTDTSIFQGIREFTTDDGETIRAERMTSGWKIAVQQENGNFLHSGFSFPRAKNPSCKSIYSSYVKSREETEDGDVEYAYGE